MDSCSGGSSSLSGLNQNSGSGDLQHVMDQRKRKRMISNRESARRSRERKQKHLDDLVAEVAELMKQNNEIIKNISVTTQHFLDFEAENCILRAQVVELSHWLESNNEIIQFIHASSGGGGAELEAAEWCFPASNYNYNYFSQPIMACADMFQY